MNIQPGGNPARVRQSNLVSIRKVIHHYAPITRVEIAARLNLTLPTITTNVNTMLSEGILQEVASAAPAGKVMGRPAIPLDFSLDCAFFLGVEIRRQRQVLCITDIRGNILYDDICLDSCEDYGRSLELACAMIRKALAAGVVPPEKLTRMGFCMPGMFDSENGILTTLPSSGWSNRPLREELREWTGFQGTIIVENNALARAIGVTIYHPKPPRIYRSFAYLFIAAGIACPLILNTDVVQSEVLGAGEIGHFCVDPAGPVCQCGKRGCLQTYASDAAVITGCRDAIRRGEAMQLAAICAGKEPTMAQVLQAQEAGDEAVDAIVRRALYYLSLSVANVINFVCPEVFVLEGMLFTSRRNREVLLQSVREQLYAVEKEPECIFIDPDVHSGALGAAALAIRSFLEGST